MKKLKTIVTDLVISAAPFLLAAAIALMLASIFAGCATVNSVVVSKHHDAEQIMLWDLPSGAEKVVIPEVFWLLYSDGHAASVTESVYNASLAPEK